MSKGVGEMVRSRSVQVKASAGTEGARRATGVPADGAAGEAGPLAPGQRWSVGRKRDVVLRLLRGESLEALSREVGVEIYRLEDWRDRAVAGLERGVQARQGDLVAETLDAASAPSGTSGSCRWRTSCCVSGHGRRSSAALERCGDVAAMSATLSEATGRPYGIQRVCQAWERSRSALYARQTREQQRHKGEEPARRGPTPTVSDATLLEAIQADLDRSPFQGEGHRKVHARLRILSAVNDD